MPIGARHHQPVQHRNIDHPLHIKPEAASGQQRCDHIATTGLSPKTTKHEIRPDTGSPQLGELPAIVASVLALTEDSQRCANQA